MSVRNLSTVARLALTVVLLALSGAAPASAAQHQAATAVPASAAIVIGTGSCVGTDACTGATGPIGDNSCNGEYACYYAAGAIGADSCNDDYACGSAAGPIGDGSCNGFDACFYAAGAIGDNSCNGEYACYEAAAPIGDCLYNNVAPAECAVQPDAWIRRAGGVWRGKDVYNADGTDQAIRSRVSAGRYRRLYIALQNDGAVAARLKVMATRGTDLVAQPGYSIRYMVGRNYLDISAAIEGTGYITPVLEPGARMRIVVRVDVGADAPKGSTFKRYVTVSSLAGTPSDTVRFVIARRGGLF